eukprot:TRINITY_DN1441_c0_g2_i3.p1 TRINITY_DN1441_c0_g2~~TRINITY_DN1441_c0_g2_i3.p1  ORF type:complete len:221 (+),score=70.86 TRINITY_DN1441_c0_g2_i3:510-1172(+)
MGGVVTANPYRGFASKLLDCINSSAKAVLYDLQRRSRGIENVFLYDRTEEMFSVERVEDSLGIAASLRALINFSSDIMTKKEDLPSELITIELERVTVRIYAVGHYNTQKSESNSKNDDDHKDDEAVDTHASRDKGNTDHQGNAITTTSTTTNSNSNNTLNKANDNKNNNNTNSKDEDDCRYHLICVSSNSIDPSSYLPCVIESISLLERVFALLVSLNE